MDHDYPLSVYNWRGRAPQPDSVSSTSYNPLPAENDYSIPRKPVSFSARSDEYSLIDPHPIHPSTTVGHQRPTFGLLPALRWWVPEILASILSIASLLAIVIVLRVYDGRSIDDLDLPRYLSLNGLVAAIATFDRVFLVVPIGSAISQEAWIWFAKNNGLPQPESHLRDLNRSDAASRGAWGSLLFIFTSPRRYLSLIGAIISVLSLAIGTFTQQLITIRNVPVHDLNSTLSPGNIPRTEYYSTFSGNPAEGAITPGLTMKAAMYNGFMTPNVEAVTANCPTGNCTFPLTPTLAVCGDCAPIAPIKTKCNETACNYTMASGSVFELYNVSATGEGIGFQSMSSRGHHWKTSILDHLYLANFDIMGAPYGSLSEISYNDLLAASECALWLCVNELNVTTESGKQTQSIVSSIDTLKYDEQDTEYTFKFPNTTTGAPTGSYTNYTSYWLAAIALQWQFAGFETLSMLNGTAFLNLESYSTSSDSLDAIWHGRADQKKWIQNVARSMSNVMRSESPTPRAIYRGTAYVQGIRVQWWWMSLPIATVGGSILLLVTVMIRTARSDVNAWKGSPLTFLLFDVDQDIRRAVVNARWTDTVSGIEHGVGKRKVTLRRQDGGRWTFKGA